MPGRSSKTGGASTYALGARGIKGLVTILGGLSKEVGIDRMVRMAGTSFDR